MLWLRNITLRHHLLILPSLAPRRAFPWFNLQLILNLLVQAIVRIFADVLAGIVLRHGLVLRRRVPGHEIAQVLVVSTVLILAYRFKF